MSANDTNASSTGARWTPRLIEGGTPAAREEAALVARLRARYGRAAAFLAPTPRSVPSHERLQRLERSGLRLVSRT